MKTILTTKILNSFRSHKPRGFYNLIKGHTGIDLNYKVGDELPSPITGKVIKISQGVTKQQEMGNVLYLQDAFGNIHVFAHLSEVLVEIGQTINRNDIVAKTGNTGSATTAPHLHWEVISSRPLRFIDRIMSRSLMGFVGYNTDPVIYLKDLYYKFHVGIDGQNITNI